MTTSEPMSAKDFRAELIKIMPGYDWTVHKADKDAMVLKATGSQSSGFNRLSTLSVVRRRNQIGALVTYEVKSAGYGLRAKWLHTYKDGTLARALRGLQNHYEAVSNTYRSHAASLQTGRAAIAKATQP